MSAPSPLRERAGVRGDFKVRHYPFSQMPLTTLQPGSENHAGRGGALGRERPFYFMRGQAVGWERSSRARMPALCSRIPVPMSANSWLLASRLSVLLFTVHMPHAMRAHCTRLTRIEQVSKGLIIGFRNARILLGVLVCEAARRKRDIRGRPLCWPWRVVYYRLVSPCVAPTTRSRGVPRRSARPKKAEERFLPFRSRSR